MQTYGKYINESIFCIIFLFYLFLMKKNVHFLFLNKGFNLLLNQKLKQSYQNEKVFLIDYVFHKQYHLN